VENVGDFYTQLAVQGPKSQQVIQRLTSAPLSDIRYYRFTYGAVDGEECLIARTGYTGEDGFEIYFAPQHSEKLWNALLDAGRADGLIPCGLGARNTLRLEAGMCLYGHEIDDTTTVWEARLDWICKMEKGEFLGRDALAAQKSAGVKRTLIGFEMQDRLIARDGCPVFSGEQQIGHVTSGSPAPFLKKNIGMAYVPPEFAAPGTGLQIGVRNQRAAARSVPLPFHKRAR
jgi:aminomethyltransferase